MNINLNKFNKLTASLACLILLTLSANTALAQDTAAAQIADAPACDCPEPKDPTDWGTSASLGFSLTSGNSDTLLLTSGISASKEENGNKWDLRLAGAYGENDAENTVIDADGNETSSSETETTVGEIVALIKYGRTLSDNERLYTGAQIDFLHDDIQNIQYRATLGIPLGYYFLKEEDKRFNMEVGPAYVWNRIDHEDGDNLSWFVSERFEWDISETAKFYEQVTYTSSVSDGDDYFLVAEAGLEAALSTNLSLVFSVRDDYINLVGDGVDRNDLSVITSLKIAL